MLRTDIHRPSSPDFDPQAYRVIGVFDNNPDPLQSGDAGPLRQRAVSALVEQGYRFGAGSSSQCGHCGTHIRYAALMVRDDVKEFIFVGEDCLDNRFDGLTKNDFQRLRKAASLNADRVRKSERVAKVYADNPGLEEALATDHHIIGDIRVRLLSRGEISEKQIALVFKIARQESERAERRIAQAAEAAALAASGVRVPAGRGPVEGVILSVRAEDGAYGFQVKVLVQSDEGWKVWGTLPRSLWDDAAVGSRIAFKATTTASDDDPVFGFFSRPTNAALVAA
jgi:hypothetical protein